MTVTSACGSSGFSTKKFAHSLCCVECPAKFVSPAEAVHGGMGALKKGNLLILVSKGGKSEELIPLAAIAKEKGAVAAVVGLPRNMDGSEGARADRCRDFARRLAVAAEISVAMTDERLTTVVASRYLNETDTRGGKRKNVIDSLSAEIILQNTLDRLKNMS